MDILRKISKEVKQTLNMNRVLSGEMPVEECYKILENNLEQREDRFLFFLKDAIYNGNRNNPYRILLKLSNIAYEDIKKMVSRQGLEGALRGLREEGVFIKFDEFRGRKKVRRKGKSFWFTPDDFLNYSFGDCKNSVCTGYTGGSTGSSVRVEGSAQCFLQRIVNEMIMIDIHKLKDTDMIIWAPSFLRAFVSLIPLKALKWGFKDITWCSPARDSSFLKKSYFFAKNFFLSGTAKGRLLICRHIPYEEAGKIADLIDYRKKQGRVSTVHTTVSGAVRICKAAQDREIDIEGTKFIVMSEPLTKRKRLEIKNSKAEIIDTYYFTEAGFIGFSCNSSGQENEGIHLLKGDFALIQDSSRGKNNIDRPDSFYFTSFYPGTPVLMLNMENGDRGVIRDEKCHCILDEYGLTIHLSNIGSNKRINTEGLTLYTDDIVDIVENEFPKEFGGSSLNYQVVEREDDNGFSKLYIYISPEIKQVDLKKIKRIISEKISCNRVDHKSKIFDQADSLLVERQNPIITRRGKQFPFLSKI